MDDLNQEALTKDKPLEILALRIPEAVNVSGLSRSKLYDEIKSGRLRAIKAGGRRLILRTDLEAFFERLRGDAD